jgi:hypothetical protein
MEVGRSGPTPLKQPFFAVAFQLVLLERQPSVQLHARISQCFVAEGDKFDAFGDAIAPSHADLQAIRSSGCEGPLPRGRGDGSVFFQKETAPVSSLDLI